MRRRAGPRGAPSCVGRRLAVAVLCAILPLAARAQATASDPEPAAEAPPPDTLGHRIVRAVKDEARRYGRDSVALVKAPLSWRRADWEKAAGAALVIGGLMFADEKIDREAQGQRSRFTDRVSAATTALGGVWGFNLSGILLGGGILLNHENMRDTGRESLEAGILAGVLDKYVIKRAFGRKRPYDSNGETVFVPGSAHDSFPSGHATQAFAVASVVAARSKGWIIPAIAYSAATIVAMDRVNNRVHFASDVVAGALLGTATGRFLVHRHRTEKEGVLSKPSASLDVVPIKNGLAVAVKY